MESAPIPKILEISFWGIPLCKDGEIGLSRCGESAVFGKKDENPATGLTGSEEVILDPADLTLAPLSGFAL